jgi:hypothetical protein
MRVEAAQKVFYMSHIRRADTVTAVYSFEKRLGNLRGCERYAGSVIRGDGNVVR